MAEIEKLIERAQWERDKFERFSQETCDLVLAYLTATRPVADWHKLGPIPTDPELESRLGNVKYDDTPLRTRPVSDEAVIKHMVDRFLCWDLPDDFAPDAGISFEPIGNKGTPHEYSMNPSGTNLLDAQQATEMVRFMVKGLLSNVNADGIGTSNVIRAIDFALSRDSVATKNGALRQARAVLAQYAGGEIPQTSKE